MNPTDCAENARAKNTLYSTDKHSSWYKVYCSLSIVKISNWNNTLIVNTEICFLYWASYITLATVLNPFFPELQTDSVNGKQKQSSPVLLVHCNLCDKTVLTDITSHAMNKSHFKTNSGDTTSTRIHEVIINVITFIHLVQISMVWPFKYLVCSNSCNKLYALQF